MSSSLTKVARVIVAAPLLCLCAFTSVAHAAARDSHINWQSPLAGFVAPAVPGATDPAPSAQELASQLTQSTGLTPSQVTVENVCPAPAPERATCDAQELVLRSTHKPVRPYVDARHTLSRIHAHMRTATPSAATASPAGTATAPLAHTPAWLQQAYDLSYLSQTAGNGKTVAVVEDGDDPTAEADLATYRSTYGLPACTTANGCFKKINQNGQQSNYPATSSADWQGESALDVDAVSALCPNCHIIVAEAAGNSVAGLDAAMQQAVTQGATIVSNSWSANATQAIPGTYTFPGVSVIASTGDHGYISGGYDAYPAAFPGVTAAGGTSLSPTTTSAPSSRGFTEASWALDSNDWGASTGCDTRETKPVWQADTGCIGRSYSDVSADANPDTGLNVYATAGGGWMLYGGTSLASPLIAAYEAVTGVNGSTPQWAYTNSALLTDPTTAMEDLTPGGNNGNCATNIFYICNAGTGYDGPTGVGSISGDVVPGAPGLGGPTIGSGDNGTGNTYNKVVSASGATLTGGVYPNSLDTTYHWEYGTTTSYGHSTSSADLGSGPTIAPVTDTLTGLVPSTTYDYRLVASNADGTIDGYNYTFTTASAGSVAPVNATLPAISGSTIQGQALTTSNGSWSPTPTGYTYQWQRSSDGANWTNISAATGATYTQTGADVGDYIDVVVTATDAWGSGAATATKVGQVLSASPVNTSRPVIAGNAKQGEVVTASSAWTPASANLTYQWQRSTDGGSTWNGISGATSSSYTLTVADESDQLRVTVTANNSYGQQSATSDPIGPVHSNPPVAVTMPTVNGTVQRTFALSATHGTWSGAGNAYAYQWQSSADNGTTWTNIPGATSFTYTLTLADEGTDIRVHVTASNVDGLATSSSDPTTPIDGDPPQNTTAPTIAGTAQRTFTLSATQGTWTGPDNTYAYQWQRNLGDGYVDIAGATGAAYTLTANDEGAAVRVVVSATNPDGSIVEASQSSGLVAGAEPANTSAPTINGTAQRGVTLSAAAGNWSGLGNTYTYQWQASSDATNWANIANATGSTYALGVADENTTVRVKVTATNADGAVTASSQPTSTIPTAAPVNTAAPTVAGVAQRTGPLTGAPGSWNGIGNGYAYQWQRSTDGQAWTDITGATSSRYTVVSADEGSVLRLRVTASNPDGTQTAASQATVTVPDAAPDNTTAPAITGSTQRGNTLTGDAGAWNGIGNTFTYQWQRSTDGQTWTNVAGAASLNYALGVADEGFTLRLQVTASNPDGTQTAATDPTAAVTASAPSNTTAPTVTGTAQRGAQLTGAIGSWAGIGNAYTASWQRSADGQTWTTIAGAGALTYNPTPSDVGFTLRVMVTATNADSTVSAASPPTSTIASAAPVNTAVPTVTGTVLRASSLSGSNGTWSGNGNTYADQWQRSADGQTWTNITGATSIQYGVTVGDEGFKLRLQVTATNADGSVAVTSDATVTTPQSPPSNTAAPTLSGPAQRTGALTVSPGAWAGIGNAYSYQWQRNTGSGFTNITSATGTGYTVTAADENGTLRAVVTAVNADGTVSAATAATATIQPAPPVNTTAPALSGTAQRGLTLSSTQGSWNGIGNTYAYQWQRSADNGSTWTNINGATASAYTLTLADETDFVRAQVITANPDATVAAHTIATTAVTTSEPVSTTAPTITGTAQRDTTLASTQGGWTGNGNSYALQWQRSADDGSTWTNITGASSASYTLGVADEGDVVRLNVTASNPDGSVTASSAATQTVSGGRPANTVLPAVTGTAQRNFVLTATNGSWTGITNTYATQWQRSADGSTWTNITGATSASYRLTVAEENDEIRWMVTATNGDGTTAAASAPTSSVRNDPPVDTTAPTVTGTPARAATLSATTGSWNGAGATFAYLWQRSADQGQTWTAIAGQTSSTYTLQKADEGDNVRVQVTATDPDGTQTASSAATASIQTAPPVNVGLPSLIGTAGQGQTLTAGTGTWKPDVTSFAYAWQRGDATDGYTNIPDATNSSYKLAADDAGETVRVVVTAVNPDATASATSLATRTVVGPPVNTSAPAAPTGTPQNTFALSPSSGSWDQTASYSYQWERCDASATAITSDCIQLPSGFTYTAAAADIGSKLGFVVTATTVGGSTSVNSPLTAVITGRPLSNLTAPAITGDPQVPNTLSVSTGAWSVALNTETYAWQRCDADGSSNCQTVGTGTSYGLTVGDQDHTVRVVINATSPGQTASVTTSPLAVEDQPVPENTSPPYVTGAVMQPTVTMTAMPGAWTNQPTGFAYQWMRCDAAGAHCQAISGATAATYTLTQADENSDIAVQATAHNGSGATAATSKPVGPVTGLLPYTSNAPVVEYDTSILSEGVRLTMVGPHWGGPSDMTTASVWERCDSNGNNCQAIPGATGSTYTTTSADTGMTLRAVSTATDSDGSRTSTSSATPRVQAAAPRWQTLPVLGADPGHVGDILHITAGTWAGPTVTSDAVQMMRCTNSCSADGSVNASSYTVTQADLGALMRVREVASNAGGATTVWATRYVGPVISAAAGASVVSQGQTAIRNTEGQTLATAQLSTGPAQMTADAISTDARKTAKQPQRTVILHRGQKVTGTLTAWVCQVAMTKSGQPGACTAKVKVTATRTVRLPKTVTGKVRVVVVKKGH